ncbi:hypothetical protein Anas_10638, partial [Armadillidium nasatum]
LSLPILIGQLLAVNWQIHINIIISYGISIGISISISMSTCITVIGNLSLKYRKMILRQSKKLFKLVLCSGRSSLRNFQRPMSDMSEVLFDEIGDVGIATLNRPQVLNALNLNMVQLLYKRLKEWENKMKFP